MAASSPCPFGGRATRRSQTRADSRPRYALSLYATDITPGVAGSGRRTPAAIAGGARTLALADADAAQRAGHRHHRARRLHRREGGTREPARTLRDRQCLPAEVRGTACGRAHGARSLARRPFRGSGRRTSRHVAVYRRRAVRIGRAIPDAGASGAAGASRRGHLPLRHGGLRRQRADSARRRARICEGASRRITVRFVAVLLAAGRTAPAKHHGPAGVERAAGARLPRCPGRRGSQTHRGDGRERRRHTDVHPRCPRRSSPPRSFRR